MKTTNLSFDAVVVGGGLTGCAAAIAAAREGLSVLLVEQEGALGGAPVNNLVSPYMGYTTTVPAKDGAEARTLVLSRGIFEQINDRLAAMGAFTTKLPCPTFNHEYLKVVLDRMCAEAGVKVLFHTALADVEKVGARIAAIHLVCKAHKIRVEAGVFIDSTGDADVAAMAEVPFRIGRSEDGLCQPMTLCFRLVGVDTSNFPHDKVNALWREKQAAGEIKNVRENVLAFHLLAPNTIHLNSTRVIKLNPVDPDDLSKAEAIAREQMIELYDFLRLNFEGFKDSQIFCSGISIGVRESRMIEARHILTAEELKACTRFPDAIAAGNYDIDIHNPAGTGTSHYYFKPGEYYTIPYSSLLPREGADNLIVAGRCIGATHEAQASIRIMPIVTTLGEAAGAAAAVANRSRSLPADIAIGDLQALLTARGAFIG